MKAVRDLIANDVVAIVGPMTSSMALVATPITNNQEIPTIGPTVSTDKLAGYDLFF